MRIGIPKEIKIDEYRVGLVPSGVRELVDAGHEVVVEQGAGSSHSYPLNEYPRYLPLASVTYTSSV